MSNPSSNERFNERSVANKKFNDSTVVNDSEFTKRLDIENVIGNIFGPDISQEVFSLFRATQDNLKTSSVLESVQVCVRRKLESIDEECGALDQPNIDSRPGRLGCKEVRFDVSSHVGLFVIGTDRLSINSQSNFSTLRANACFYKGKWQYEVQLGSKGVMQIGWAMSDCKFSQEIGVGDTVNSYSYDGHRVRRWNMSTYAYGEPWLSGDIIGCTIDLDIGSVEFYRNGRSMGQAFDKIQMGPGYAYFPAVSLAFTENLVANFGSSPLKYPVIGFQTPQKPPVSAVAKANLLFDWFQQLIALSDPKYQNMRCDNSAISQNGVILVIGHMLIQYLAPLLHNPFIIESCFVPFLIDLGKKAITPGKKMPTRVLPAIRLNNFLDLFWIFLEEYEIRRCFEVVASCLQAKFRRVSFTTEYVLQKETLQLLVLLFRHQKTRFYFLQNILFDKGRFANFMHVKPLDDSGLTESIPDPWWNPSLHDNGSSSDIKFAKYIEDCLRMKQGIAEVELMQIDLMLTLLENSDGSLHKASSRRLFLSKFRMFLHENFLYSRSLSVAQTPLPITLCCFHRLISCAQILSEKELKTSIPKIPTKVFYDGTINYLNIDRFGGVLSHLQKLLRQELIEELGPGHPVLHVAQEPFSVSTQATMAAAAAAAAATGGGAAGGAVAISPANASGGATADPNLVVAGTSAIADISPAGALMVPLLARMLQGQNGGVFAMMSRGQQAIMQGITDQFSDLGAIDNDASIIEFIDGLILFYHLAAHKQLAKVATLRENMEEYEAAMAETKLRLEKYHSLNDPLAISSMERTIEVYESKLSEQSRHMAWVRAAVYSPEKQAHLVWLLKIVVGTLQAASDKGKLFSFVPEFYLETLVELTTALKNYFNPTVPFCKVEGHREIMTDVGQFLCNHFADPRIVHASSKDTLIQALANFVCNPNTLQFLEELPVDSRVTMVRGLLRPYENRAWAQSNWVLVRFWQGKGFAFRYKKSPHLHKKMGPKINPNETTLIGQAITDPCPSAVFQNHVCDIMLIDEKLAASFINSVLNQLNWAFSEFIGMLQEIQNLSTRPERVFIESRQLKICATCFDLTLALLRVLEMIANIAQPVFSDMARPSAESLLERICQLLCQILNRVSSVTGCFHYVVSLDIPDLEAVDHFPILAAVIGILIGLLKEEMSLTSDIDHPENEEFDESKPFGASTTSALGVVSRALLIEPSFQLSSLVFLIDDASKRAASSDKLKFSFHKYPDDVTPSELQTVNKVIEHLQWCQHRLSLCKEMDEDTLCSICYAYPTCTVFYPCSHQSCRSCIVHHLMNNQDCFFCKTPIQKVTMVDGKVLFESPDITAASTAATTGSYS